MNFYFTCRYTTAKRRVGLFKRLFAPELISIAITCDNGNSYYAINTDFSARYANEEETAYIYSLPSLIDPEWKPVKQIVKELVDYLYENDKDTGPFVFVHDNDVVGCSVLTGLFGESKGFIDFVDLSQVVEEYVDCLYDDDFGINSPYRFEKIKESDKRYTLEDKMEMFATHEHYPRYINRLDSHPVVQVDWVKALSTFMDNVKHGTFDNTENIEHEDN